MISRIRYFNTLLDLAKFRRGFGLFGWCVYVLGLFRTWLERQLVLAALRLQLKAAGFSKKEIDHAIKVAKDHPQVNPHQYHSSLRRADFNSEPSPLRQQVMERAARYHAGRLNTDETPYERPIPIEEGLKVTLAGYEQRRNRSARYVAGASYKQIDESFNQVTRDPELSLKGRHDRRKATD